MELRIGNDQTLVQVLPEKAMLIPEYGLLVVSDIHLGKDIHFRSYGIPIPSQVGDKTFSALDDLLTKYTFNTVLFLGDLFHSLKNKSFETFASWIEKWDDAASFKLILGNHDMYPTADYEGIGLQSLSQYTAGSLLFEHQHRAVTDDFYHISGHIHPAVRLKGKGKQSMKLPCFWFSSQFAILPAFGHFTGTYVIDHGKEDRIFVVDDGTLCVHVQVGMDFKFAFVQGIPRPSVHVHWAICTHYVPSLTLTCTLWIQYILFCTYGCTCQLVHPQILQHMDQYCVA